MLDVSNELKSALLDDRIKKNIDIEFEGEGVDFSKVNFYSFQRNYPGEGWYGGIFSNVDVHNPVTFSVPFIYQTNTVNEVYKYASYAKYLYLKIKIKISSFTSTVSPSKAALLWSYATIRSDGIPTRGFREFYRTDYDFSATYPNEDIMDVEAILELPVKPNNPGDLFGLLKDGIAIQVLDENGEAYAENTIGSLTIYMQFNDCQIQLGNDYSQFPYENTTQVQFEGLNFNDYITIPSDVKNRFSQINWSPLANPFRFTATHELSQGWGKTFANSLFVKYANMGYQVLMKGQFKVTRFEPAEGVPMPTHFKATARVQGQYSEGSLIPYDLNTVHDFNILTTLGHGIVYGSFGIYVTFINENYNYTSSDMATFSIGIESLEVYIGNSEDMPYSDTVPVEQLGYNINDYLVDNTFSVDNNVLVKESFQLSESLSSTDNLKFGATEAATCEFDAVGLPDNKDLVGTYFRPYISADGIDEKLPLGRFRVRKVTKTGSHDIVTKHIEAYDGVYALNRDASNWYTKYMGGINTTPEYPFTSLDGFDFPRQMFSTLYNACKAAGIMLDVTNVENFNITGASTSAGRRIFKEHTDPEEGGYGDSDYIEYVGISTAYNQVNVKKLMRLCLEDIYDYQSEIDAYKEDAPYTNSFGFSPASGILIYVLDNNSNVINQFCVNDNEWFALPDNTDFVIFSIPKKYHLYMGMRLHELTLDIPSTIKIQTADFNQLASKNLSARLVYYNWKTFDIAMPSNPSFRDVIRSLIEITGHFFRYGRDGEIEFIKCDVAGLYPSNNLYPDDDLYPRGGLSTQPVPMGRYEYFKADDKATNHFGKIQILLNTPNENEPATKTYKGSDNKNTYVMSDNVFYCSAGVSYALKEDGSEPLPEVLTTLANMYEIIQSVYYTPCEVDAIGMPWVECGDRIGLLTKYGGFETFIFRRTLSGIQRLTDFYEALGQENTDSVPDVWE